MAEFNKVVFPDGTEAKVSIDFPWLVDMNGEYRVGDSTHTLSMFGNTVGIDAEHRISLTSHVGFDNSTNSNIEIGRTIKIGSYGEVWIKSPSIILDNSKLVNSDDTGRIACILRSIENNNSVGISGGQIVIQEEGVYFYDVQQNLLHVIFFDSCGC